MGPLHEASADVAPVESAQRTARLRKPASQAPKSDASQCVGFADAAGTQLPPTQRFDPPQGMPVSTASVYQAHEPGLTWHVRPFDPQEVDAGVVQTPYMSQLRVRQAASRDRTHDDAKHVPPARQAVPAVTP